MTWRSEENVRAAALKPAWGFHPQTPSSLRGGFKKQIAYKKGTAFAVPFLIISLCCGAAPFIYLASTLKEYMICDRMNQYKTPTNRIDGLTFVQLRLEESEMSAIHSANTKSPIWLSMIIPVYQAEKYISRCIETVLSQSFKGFELILVDDGSTDGSAQICKRYAEQDQRVRYCYKENGGSLSARLYGIERAAGEYIGFMDADYYLIGDHVFDSLHKKAEEYDCDLIQFGYVKKYNHMKKEVRTVQQVQHALEEEFNHKDYPRLLCSFWDSSRLTTNVWNKIYRRSLTEHIDELKNEGRVFWGDDQILNLYLLSGCKSALFLPDVFYVYRQFSGGTSRYSRTEMKDLDMIKKHQLKLLQSYEGDSVESIRSILFSEVAGWFFAYIKKGMGILSAQEMKSMIEETLEYPAFKMARAYYAEHKSTQWEPVQLLMEGNPQKYMEKAIQTRRGFKDKIRDMLKWLYYRI